MIRELTVRLCRTPVLLRLDDPDEAAAIVAYLRPALRSEVPSDELGGVIQVGRSHVLIQRGPDVSFIPEHSVGNQLERVLLEWCSALHPGAVTLHAGCVNWRGRNILFVAESGGGKSSMTRAAVRSGASYLTDDLTLVTKEFLSGLARSIRFDAVLFEARERPAFLDGMDLSALRFSVEGGPIRVIPSFAPEAVEHQVELANAPTVVVRVSRGEDAVSQLSSLERIRILHEATIRTGPEYDGSLGEGPTFDLRWGEPARAWDLLSAEVSAC